MISPVSVLTRVTTRSTNTLNMACVNMSSNTG